MSSTGAKGSHQTNTKLKEKAQKIGAKETEVLPGLAHRPIRCTREDRPQTLQLRVSQAQLRYNSSDCPVCQQSNDYLRATVDSDSEQCSIVNAAEVRTIG